jgi:hypothetical protein
MVGHNFAKKKNAQAYARKMTGKGYSATVYKKKKGYGCSVTRK